MDDSQRIAELERRVQELEKQMMQVLDLVTAQPAPEPEQTLAERLDVDPTVLKLIQRDKLIQAIKLYRELSDADLRTAKDYIDRIAALIEQGKI